VTDIERREAFEQAVTDILFGLSDWLDLQDGPDVDDAREAVMGELLAYADPRAGVGAVEELRGLVERAVSLHAQPTPMESAWRQWQADVDAALGGG
jgi:hypothetical protein